MALSGPSKLVVELCCRRFAESWIGVSGLDLAGQPPATSDQARVRWADTTSVMSSNTSSRSLPRSAPRASSVAASGPPARNSKVRVPPLAALARFGRVRRSRNAVRRPGRTPAARAGPRAVARAGLQRLSQDARGTRVDARDAAVVVEQGTTPAVRLSRMVRSRAAPRRTRSRASATCWVMSAKERVKPPSSSSDPKTGRARRLPAATSRTPSASSSSGLTICCPAALPAAPRRNRQHQAQREGADVDPPQPRARARCWYSR